MKITIYGRKGAYFGGLFIMFIIAVIGFMLLLGGCNQAGSPAQKEISTFERVIKDGKIRCGWVTNPPACFKDAKTGELKGIFVEAIETAAEKMKLKVEWTEEVGFGSMIEGLKANRYDMVPCAIWPTSARAREADFSIPLYYSGVCAYVRADDNRFFNKLDAINSPNITIATIDGEMAKAIAATDFPQAKTLELPQLSDISTMLLNVKEKKADVTFVELFFAFEFLKNNPGSIKNITPGNPVRVFPNTILLPRNQPEFEALVNTALEELTNLGTVDKLIDKYEPYPGTFYRLNLPYRSYAK